MTVALSLMPVMSPDVLKHFSWSNTGPIYLHTSAGCSPVSRRGMRSAFASWLKACTGVCFLIPFL